MIPIQSIMTSNVITVRPYTPISEALDILGKHKISGLIVTNENNEVVGILSEKDVLKIFFDEKINVSAVVDDYMTRDVISFTEDASADAICKIFMKGHIRRVPITKDNKLVGVISRKDILSVIIEAKSKMSSMRYV